MANVVQHCLKAENLKNLLQNAGVVSEQTLHGRRNREVQRLVLNMKMCCEDEWKKDEASAIAYGVLDFSQKSEDGHWGVRRDLTETEIAELPYWPIAFISDDSIVWECCWKANDDPAFFISKLFPNLKFSFERFYEGRPDGAFNVVNGEFTTTEENTNTFKNVMYHQVAETSSNFVEEIPF